MVKNIEVEVRGVLTEEEHKKLVEYLDKNSNTKELDDRRTVFFIMSGKTLKVTDSISKGKAKIALKMGDIALDHSQTEYEIPIAPDDYETAVNIFKNLGFTQIQHTEQKRTNYTYKDYEFAVKWSIDWGYHFELDKVIHNEIDVEKTREELIQLVESLGLMIMDEEEFKRRCEEIDSKYNPKS